MTDDFLRRVLDGAVKLSENRLPTPGKARVPDEAIILILDCSCSMDGPCGDEHTVRGAWITFALTRDWFLSKEVLYHSRFYAGVVGERPSRLCWADKWGTSLYPSWLWATLAYLSGEGWEYMGERKYEIHRPGDPRTWRGLYGFHVRLKAFFAEGLREWALLSQ